MLKKLFILTVAVSSLAACSSEESQKTKDLQEQQRTQAIFADGTELEVEPRQEVVQTAMQSLFYINPKSSLIFVQGQSKKVYFDVRLAFADLDGLKYNIKMTDGPADLGARFGKDANGYFLQWSPRLGIINNQENAKDYKIKLQFELNSASSDSNKSELSGQDLDREYWVTLMKNRTQPVIKNVKYSSADQTLNPDTAGTISFTVEMNGSHNANDISVGPVPAKKEDDSPALELVQLSGIPALSGYPKRVSVTRPSAGITHYNYQVQFDANMMIDHADKKIEANPTLKARKASGRINSAEGVFAVEAYNADNGMRSQQKKVMFKVNLTPKAANAVLLGPESLTFKQGSGWGNSFQMKSAGGKGSIEVTSEIPEVDGVKIELDCGHSSKMANREIGCYSSNCMLQCVIQASSRCDAKPGVVDVPVKATTKLYEDQKESVFNIRVRVNANPEFCTGGQS